ncbi:MAG: hypothetical protein UZ22_OP11002000943, partial [Microgenomates bacterium OLB23]
MGIGEILLTIVLSAIISYIASPAVIKLAYKLRLVDDTRFRKHPANVHTGVIPRAGGLGIYFAIVVASLFFIEPNKLLYGILLGGFLIVIMGIL